MRAGHGMNMAVDAPIHGMDDSIQSGLGQFANKGFDIALLRCISRIGGGQIDHHHKALP